MKKMILFLAAGLLAVGWSSVQAADLCSTFDNTVYLWIFPKVIKLGPSNQFNLQGGPRTCSFLEERRIFFRCLGGSAQTQINVVSARNRRRRIFPVLCDGSLHSISKSAAYFGLTPPFHIRWRLNDGSWTDAFIRLE